MGGRGLLQGRTALAFAGLVAIGGSNAVAVRLSNSELPPFWGASMRFMAAAALFWLIVGLRRLRLPRGRALAGVVLFGSLSIGGAYAFLYWGLQFVQANITMVVLALVPLLTFFLAVIHRSEPFRLRGLFGAVIAFAGVLLGVSGQLGDGVDLVPLLAIIGGGLCMAESNVVFKLLPETDPIATNAIAVSTGAVILGLISLIVGEPRQLPVTAAAQLANIYLVLIGSGVLFYLYLYVLGQWTASATSYAFLLFPVTTTVIAALFLGERATPTFAVGALLVVVGVWVGAVNPGRAQQG